MTNARVVVRNRNNRTWTHFGINDEERFIYGVGPAFTTKAQALRAARRAAAFFNETEVEVGRCGNATVAEAIR